MGLVQYPDTKLYKAATMLTPEERPTAPVKLRPSDKKTETEAMYDNRSGEISVMQGGKAYKDFDKNPQRLAAALAHEGEHVRQGQTPSEAPAYRKQVDVLNRLGETDKHMLIRLMEAEQRWGRLERK